jgi:N-acetylneuraminate synthase/N,N'-diacetyllegionaminate synthase
MVAGRTIGGGAPCFVIAEAGRNHNGDLALAHQLIDVAAAAGADAVTFQTFDPSPLVTPEAPKAPYQKPRALPLSAYTELQRHASDRSIAFLSMAFDEESADFLDQLGVPAFTVPSGELTNYPFIEHLARKRKPLFVSTGMGTLEEVAGTVEAIRGAGDPPFALLYCVTSCPAPVDHCNLSAISTLQHAFKVPVGWSDHTLGVLISLGAAALGAAVIEKHFTLDRALPGPDHAASLEPSELAELVRSVRALEVARGDGLKRPAESEAPRS